MRICIVGAGSEIAKAWRECRRMDEVILVSSTRDEVKYGNMEQVKETGIDRLVVFNGSDKNSNKLDAMSNWQWTNTLEICLTSVFVALKHGLPKMNDGGSVVVVGSIVGSTGGYGCANYAAAKAGLVGLVRAAANEMLSRRIRVNLLELGYVNAGMGARLPEKVKAKVTETIPMRRFAELDEVVHAIDFLASQTYMTGNVLTFAGGLR
jgi:3-oxoacyl-[acyl-carrier protein] reductase